MDNLPKIVAQEITKNNVVEVSDWVKSALEKAKELVSYPYEKNLANELIQRATYEMSGLQKLSVFHFERMLFMVTNHIA